MVIFFHVTRVLGVKRAQQHDETFTNEQKLNRFPERIVTTDGAQSGMEHCACITPLVLHDRRRSAATND